MNIFNTPQKQSTISRQAVKNSSSPSISQKTCLKAITDIKDMSIKIFVINVKLIGNSGRNVPNASTLFVHFARK